MNRRELIRLKICLREFMIGVSELTVEFMKGCRDIVKQSLVNEDSFIVKKCGKFGKRVREPCEKLFNKFRFFNDYLPEDKDPFHAWFVILFVSLLAFSALYVNLEHDQYAPLVKQVFLHPASATRILLPDGRYMAYREQGVSADRARFSVIAPHTFLSSRLAGIPGVKDSLMEEFGIHLITYDLPGFGESDPHPNRNLESSALDMLFLADALGVDKFWVIGYSSGSKHAWAALRYIPDRLAGAAMFAPMVNPYDPLMTKDERRRTWNKWTRKRKLMYFLARSFPRLLAFFYQRSFLSGKHGQMDRWLSLSLGNRDKALIEDPIYEDFWQRDVEESIRQGNVKPFVEEASLQVSNWGFSLLDLKLQKRKYNRNVLNWLKAIFTETQEYTGFLGPIHIWQGMDDKVVPPSMTDFVHRVLPGAAVHKLPYEGHFTYIYFCDECHRQIFMENQIEVENQQQKPSQPCSQSSSPSHEFSFTISHNSFNTTFPNNNNNKSKLSSHNSFTALDLSPADDIFFHGHLLPLQILSHFPSSISPRSSTNSMDSFTLPIRELFSEDDENLPTKDSSKSENIESSKKVEGKSKFSFLLFSSNKGTKGCIKEKKNKEKNKKKLIRFDFDVLHVVKKYLRKVKPFFKREKIREHKKSYSYSGNVTPRNKQELMKGNWSMKLGEYYSAPASMRTSPSNSGVLFATTPLPPPSDSSMEELQAAIQSAIAHCKNSYSKDQKLNC